MGLLTEIREAIVLAGGLGTRLKSVTGDTPKVMSLVGGRPFMEYILDYLSANGISRVIIAAGYGSDILRNHFGNSYRNIEIIWSQEMEPLGTGGAILQATGYALSDTMFVINGDTIFDVPLQAMAVTAGSDFKSLCIALKPMNDFERYGAVEISNGIVHKFVEKSRVGNGLINGGVYLMSKEWLLSRSRGSRFSFENEILERYVNEGEISAYICDKYFIDIGIPADWERAQNEVPGMFGMRAGQ
jgi:D-glycero-alpha-D-manno-heptose 1-phosphate guanylyltransferase